MEIFLKFKFYVSALLSKLCNILLSLAVIFYIVCYQFNHGWVTWDMFLDMWHVMNRSQSFGDSFQRNCFSFSAYTYVCSSSLYLSTYIGSDLWSIYNYTYLLIPICRIILSTYRPDFTVNTTLISRMST